MRTPLLFFLYMLSTPFCALARLVRDPLDRGWLREASTYWIAPKPISSQQI